MVGVTRSLLAACGGLEVAAAARPVTVVMVSGGGGAAVMGAGAMAAASGRGATRAWLLEKDREIVLVAVTRSGYALQYADDSLTCCGGGLLGMWLRLMTS